MLDDTTVYAAGARERDDVHEPDGVGPFCPIFDSDALVEQWSDLDCEGRRRVTSRGRTARQAGDAARRYKTPERPKINLILYMSPESDKSRRALRAVREVLRDYEPAEVNFSTCDLSSQPQAADVHSIVFTPTLVTQGSGPRTAIIGNLEDKDVLRDVLDANGVARRWDD
jgi:hypothetical protein